MQRDRRIINPATTLDKFLTVREIALFPDPTIVCRMRARFVLGGDARQPRPGGQRRGLPDLLCIEELFNARGRARVGHGGK